MAELWREYRYRTHFHATEAEYAEAGATKTDWMMALAGLESELRIKRTGE